MKFTLHCTVLIELYKPLDSGLNFSLGKIKRPWNKIKDKWQDMKSKAISKETKNRTETGNKDPLSYTDAETRILDFLRERKSNLVEGIPEGFDSAADEVCSTEDFDIVVLKICQNVDAFVIVIYLCRQQ